MRTATESRRNEIYPLHGGKLENSAVLIGKGGNLRPLSTIAPFPPGMAGGGIQATRMLIVEKPQHAQGRRKSELHPRRSSEPPTPHRDGLMLLPLRSDSEFRYRPIATTGLIVANIAAAYLLDLGRGPLTDSWMLVFRQGLHPLQWLTCSFVHFGLMHLIGNMIFLWVFGLGVEGRVGWWRFLLLYLGIGIAGGMIAQLCLAEATMNSPISPRGAGGASLAIFGIMAVALVWHPFTELDCLWICCWHIRVLAVERINIGIFWFAGFHVLKEIWCAGWLYGAHDIGPSSASFHSLGAALGAAAGLVLLKQNLVDCEGQDIFNVGKSSSYFDQFKSKPTAGTHFGTATASAAESVQKSQTREQKTNALYRDIRNQNGTEAAEQLKQLPATSLTPLEPKYLKQLGDGLYREGQFNAAAQAYRRIVSATPDPPPAVSLKLAAILLEINERPRAALRVLDEINESRLSPSQSRKHRQIRTQAETLIDSGHLELTH